MGKMLYGTSQPFREWCLDYFEYLWKHSNRFQEHKLAS